MLRTVSLALVLALLPLSLVHGQGEPLARMDVFDLEWGASPQIAPNGERVVYERHGMDVMTDR